VPSAPGGAAVARRGVRRLVVGIDASRAFGARATGTERYATAVITHLVAGDTHCFRLYFRARPNLAPPPGADVRVLAAPRLWTHTRLLAEVLRDPPDVLFVPAHVLPLVAPCPSVVTVHDLGFLAYPETHTWSQRAYLGWTTRRHVRRATRLIADSAATRDDLVARYGAAPDRVTVVHLGVDAAMRAPAAAAVAPALRRSGLDPARRYVLHVGTLQPRKNLARLVRAFGRLTAAWADLDLVLVGRPGWGREDLPALAHALGQSHRVHFPGYVAREDLPALYAGAAVVAVPSLYEGFGLPVLEAMACGAPVVASRASSLPEVVGDAALLFDPLDEAAMAAVLDRVLGDGVLRARLARAGMERAGGFTWERCAGATRDVLEAAAGAPGP
jgi:glycosyltransferase involved in cell wall biosynthesis